jgi:hypothetical protein
LVNGEQIMSNLQIGTATPTDAIRRWGDSLVGAIREEFTEMPCMRLTRAQFRRLWHLTAIDSERLVDDLIAMGFLAEDPQGRICRGPQVH